MPPVRRFTSAVQRSAIRRSRLAPPAGSSWSVARLRRVASRRQVVCNDNDDDVGSMNDGDDGDDEYGASLVAGDEVVFSSSDDEEEEEDEDFEEYEGEGEEGEYEEEDGDDDEDISDSRGGGNVNAAATYVYRDVTAREFEELIDDHMEETRQSRAALRAKRAVKLLPPSTEQVQLANCLHIKHSLTCPITNEIMKCPVVAPDGHTYDREAIVRWLSDNSTSPLTGARMSIQTLFPNFIIAKIVDELSLLNQK